MFQNWTKGVQNNIFKDFAMKRYEETLSFINITGMKQQYSMQGVMDIEDLVKFGEKNK